MLRLSPNGPTERDVRARARKHSVDLDTLDPHWINPGTHPPGVVIGHAAPAPHAFRPTLRSLIDVLELP